jgi:thioredoxin-like negative regulator of GroEL
MSQTELKTTEQAEGFIKKEIASLLYFYSDSCAPCVSLRPKVIELLENSFPKMKLAFVNSAIYPLVAANFNVFSNPALLIFFEGKEYNRLSKYVSISQLEEIIDRPYQMVF